MLSSMNLYFIILLILKINVVSFKLPTDYQKRAVHSIFFRNNMPRLSHNADAAMQPKLPALIGSNTHRAPSMFCFMVIRPNTYEAELLKLHFEKGLISGCDGHEVYSNVTAEKLLSGVGLHSLSEPHKVVVSALLDSMETRNIVNKYAPTCPHIACNTNLFKLVWTDLINKKRHQQFDWIVKLDADTVFVPSRLRRVLEKHSSSEPVFLLDQRFPGGPFELTGAIEVYSQKAVQIFADGMHRCPWPSQAMDSEDQHMHACLFHYLHAQPSNEPDLVSPIPFKTRVAVHPLKDRTRFLKCIDKFDTCFPDLLCIPDSLKSILAPKI